LATLDAVVWIAVFAAIAGLETVGDFTSRAWIALSVVALCAQWALGYAAGLYRGRANLGSADQAVLLASVVLSSGAAALVVSWVLTGGTAQGWVAASWAAPRAVITATLVVLLVTGGVRLGIRRVFVERRPIRASDAHRVLIFGSGEGGQQLLRSMIITGHLMHGGGKRAGDFWPVGLLDDDPTRQRLRIMGVPVLGTSEDIAVVARQTRATMLVLAIPSADANLVRRIAGDAAGAGLRVKTLPSLSELTTPESVGVGDMRDVQMADLLGRHQIDTDVASIAGYLTGKRVLVTGAGGSIGSELCRQIHRFSPAELIMLDRDESALHAVQLSIHGFASLGAEEVVLADIRDTRHIAEIFLRRKPDVVFHAAALKHLNMLEQYPGEAIKTNVWGTASVLQAAQESGVRRFINISTDKAASPCSVLGYSKRLAEGLTAAVAARADGTFLSVRFGNVLGSRGSVVTTFTAQIEGGGPVTVTHPDVTRYFMTVQEAVQLVVQAAAIGRDGEALVLDMGEPVRISDVAQQLIDMSGRDVDIVYTGLRDGEKLHEDLFAEGERDHRPVHPLVSHVSVPGVDDSSVLGLDPYGNRESVLLQLSSQCADMQALESQGVLQ